MKTSHLAAVLVALTLPAAAHAVKLVNKDSETHEISIKCSTTTHTSIGGNVTRDIGNGPCTVTIKKTNASGSGSGNDTLEIRNGAVARK